MEFVEIKEYLITLYSESELMCRRSFVFHLMISVSSKWAKDIQQIFFLK